MNLWQVSRRFLGSPVFTATTLLTLAIGIGTNSAIFNVRLKPLHSASLQFDELNISPSLYFVSREEIRTVSNIGLWTGGTLETTSRPNFTGADYARNCSSHGTAARSSRHLWCA